MSHYNILTALFKLSSILELEQVQQMIADKRNSFTNTRKKQIKTNCTLNTGEALPVTGNINDKISVCLKIVKEGQKVILRGNSEWSGISLELSILIYTVTPENTKKLLVGIRNWNYIFTLSLSDFIIYIYIHFT